MNAEKIIDESIEDLLNEAGFETTRLDRSSERDGPVWECKIGLKKGTVVNLLAGADFPMRQAIEKAFFEITGLECDFNFPGWGAELSKTQLDVIEDRG